MSESLYESLPTAMADGGAEAALEHLAARLRAEQKFHELFDARLMLARHRLGLPLIGGTSIDELPEPLRTQTEEAYLTACREVGELLVREGKLREAWMYLRPVGEKKSIAAALERAEVDDANLDELVELALHEGVAPAQGFQMVLDHYGTCNAITMFESMVSQQPLAAQTAAAERLIEHLYRDLLESVRLQIEGRHPGAAADKSLGELVAEQPWMFDNESYHIDISHLASTVRYARLVSRPEPLQQAWELTEYGRRLAAQYQFAGEEPFAEIYPSHGLLFAATLGRQVDEAIAYFRSRAEQVDPQQEGTGALETYLILLARLARHREAMEEMARLAPRDLPLSGYAPKLFELASACGAFARYLDICREREDLLGYAAGLIAESGEQKAES